MRREVYISYINLFVNLGKSVSEAYYSGEFFVNRVFGTETCPDVTLGYLQNKEADFTKVTNNFNDCQCLEELFTNNDKRDLSCRFLRFSNCQVSQKKRLAFERLLLPEYISNDICNI